MWIPRSLLVLFSFFTLTNPTLVSDTGCLCALTKTTSTTPNASSTIAVGCSSKTDWNSQVTEWCLTDQTNGLCGSFQPSFGYTDSCVNVALVNPSVVPAVLLEWDQTPSTFYTGQTMTLTWDSVNIQPDEWLRIQYQGTNLRTLTAGSGVNITAKEYSVRLSDSSNMITTAAVPIQFNLPANPSITANTNTTITVFQSKILNIGIVKDNVTVNNGNTLLCDNGNLLISWRGVGQAQIGTVTVTVKSTFGSGTTVGTPVTGLNATANMTVNYILPRSFSPSGFANYAATVSVQEPGQTAYSLTSSVTFKLSAAPSTSPTPTSSITPTPSNSPTPSITPSISITPTPSKSATPSMTSTLTSTPTISDTPSATPSITPTSAPSLDLAALVRNAANSVDTQTPAIAGALGGIGGIIMLLGAFKWYQQKQLTQKRLRRLAMTNTFVQNRNSVYGIQDHGDPQDHISSLQPAMVMYTVANMPPRKKAFEPKSAK